MKTVTANSNRPNVVRAPAFYAGLGFTLYATPGTGQVISDAGIPVNILSKLANAPTSLTS